MPPNFQPTARAAHEWLERDDYFGRLRQDAQRLVSLQSALERVAPEAPSRAVRLEGTTLSVNVEGSAMAARLRQLEPAIVRALGQAGWRIERLKIRTRAPADVAPPVYPRPAPPPQSAGARLEALANELEASPLQAGVAQLARTIKRRSSRAPTAPDHGATTP